MRLIGAWRQRWRHSTLLRRMGALTSGTALAQAIQLLNLVALAKLYPLGEVGSYSVFAAVVGTLAPVVLLGYEMLVPASRDEDLMAFLQAQLLVLLLPMTSLLGLITSIAGYEHALPVALWIGGAMAQRLAEMYSVRQNRFHMVVMARLSQPLTMAVLLALAWQGNIGMERLIVLQASLVLLSGLGYAALTLPWNRLLNRPVFGALQTALRQGANAPLYLMPSNLLNLVAYNVPVLVIGRYFGPELAAQYAYVLRFGFGPVGLLGNTLYQVFYGFMAEAARSNDHRMYQQFIRSRQHIKYLALAVAAAMAFAYPLGFRYVLGHQWITAGWVAMIFSPFFASMLYLTPLSVSLNVFNRQHYELKSQLHYFLISLLSFGAAVLVDNPWVGFVLFSSLGCLRYGLLLADIDKVLIEHQVIGHEPAARA